MTHQGFGLNYRGKVTITQKAVDGKTNYTIKSEDVFDINHIISEPLIYSIEETDSGTTYKYGATLNSQCEDNTLKTEMNYTSSIINSDLSDDYREFGEALLAWEGAKQFKLLPYLENKNKMILNYKINAQDELKITTETMTITCKRI